MNGASKILTVSYGTFSCTLEGFDDPFNTMKAIAEYFRDLAAGDRYFGAEPPTPDAAMLHQIAEREIQRRVEAKIQDNGVVLRASDQSEAAPSQIAAPSVAAVAVADAAVADAVATPEPMPAPVAAQAVSAPPSTTTPSVAPASAPATESVVEKLSRLRSEIAAHPAAPAPVQTAPIVSFAIPDYLEDQDADTLDATALADFLPEDEGQTFKADLPEDVAEDTPVEELRTEAPMMAEAASDGPFEEDAAEISDLDLSAVMANSVTVDADPADVDLAALMADLSEEPSTASVVEEATTETSDDAIDAAAEADVMDTLSTSLRAALADATDREIKGGEIEGGDVADGEIPADHFDTAPQDAPAATTEDDTILLDGVWAETASESVAEADHDDVIEPIDAAQVAASDVQQPFDTSAETDAIWAETWAETSDAEVEAEAGIETEATATAVPAPELSAEETPKDEAKPTAEDDASGMELRPGAAEKLQRARARVIRIRKNDDAAPAAAPSVAPPVVEAPAGAAQEEPAPVASAAFAEIEDEMSADMKRLLSAEDEAELQRELAALRHGEEENDANVVAGLAHLTQQQDSRKGFEGPSADEALSRLMKQTDNEMQGSETKRRQSAIQHLKAAVAATVADRKVTGEKAGETETVSRLARYRSDLAMAVKAALPGARGAAPGERPAPLVLVSEQRIDRPRPGGAPNASTTTAPIRPRRVTSGGLGMATAADLDMSDDDEDEAEDLSNMFGDSKGFSEFVEKIGATSFEQILEASAAYLAGVEGRPHFSRPQLMRHVTEIVPQGSFQREDGLRSFGSLLRDGRIAKVRRGQFMVSEDSAYLAEARKLVQ